MSQDEEHLRLLSIFHYVVAGLAALFAMFPVIHLVIGLAMLTGRLDGEGEDARIVGCMFIAIALLIIGLGLAFAVLLALAGRFLVQRRHYTYCLVVAAIACLLMPVGTVLGVFTIIVLMRESVRELFGMPVAAGE